MGEWVGLKRYGGSKPGREHDFKTLPGSWIPQVDWPWSFKWYQEGTFFGSWGTLRRPFGALGVALGAHFGDQGLPLDAFGAQSLQKTPPSFPLASL